MASFLGIRRKIKIPIKNVPPAVNWILQNATLSQLQFLHRMAKAEDFSLFVNLISAFKHYNVYEVYNFEYQTPEQLVAFKAAKVGEVAGLDALIKATQLAGEEIQKRKSKKEVR